MHYCALIQASAQLEHSLQISALKVQHFQVEEEELQVAKQDFIPSLTAQKNGDLRFLFNSTK